LSWVFHDAQRTIREERDSRHITMLQIGIFLLVI
jgi:hypothetical protein